MNYYGKKKFNLLCHYKRMYKVFDEIDTILNEMLN